MASESNVSAAGAVAAAALDRPQSHCGTKKSVPDLTAAASETCGGLVAPSFDYTAVAADLAETLREDAERIRHRITKTTFDLIEIGRDPKATKTKLDHGHFLQWVESEIGIHRHMAQRYMGVADLAESKGDSLSLLTPTAAYKLAAKSTPPEVVDAVLQRTEAGGLMSEQAIGSLIRERKEKHNKRDRPQDDQAAPTVAPDPAKSLPNEEDQGRPEHDDAEGKARKLFDKLGPELARVVVNALGADANAVVNKLKIVLADTFSAPRAKSEDR